MNIYGSLYFASYGLLISSMSKIFNFLDHMVLLLIRQLLSAVLLTSKSGSTSALHRSVQYDTLNAVAQAPILFTLRKLANKIPKMTPHGSNITEKISNCSRSEMKLFVYLWSFLDVNYTIEGTKESVAY